MDPGVKQPLEVRELALGQREWVPRHVVVAEICGEGGGDSLSAEEERQERDFRADIVAARVPESL